MITIFKVFSKIITGCQISKFSGKTLNFNSLTEFGGIWLLGFNKSLTQTPCFQMQLEFNKNLTQTLNEKKKEFRMMKENHYDEIGVLKIKMNDAVSVQIKLESLWVTL